MFEKFKSSKLFFWSFELLIIASLFYVCTQISFVFKPIGIFVDTIFLPLLLSGFIFYLLSPIVKLLEKVHIRNHKIPHTLSVILVMLIVFLILAGALVLVVPQLINQITKLLANLPSFTASIQEQMNHFMQSDFAHKIDLKASTDSIQSSIEDYAKGFLMGTANGLGVVIGKITSFTITAITVPVMVFYMLNDGHKLMPSIKRFFEPTKAKAIEELMVKMSKTISQYIDGQAIECLFIFVFTSIGYFIIGQPYALLLGVVAGIANVIPYVGPYIGIFPALFVGLPMGVWHLIWIVVVVVVVQQVDGNLVYPNVIGKTLQIHPLTIIIILLAAGNIAGIGGMILGIPFYAIVRTILEFFWHLYRVQHTNYDENGNEIKVEVLKPKE